MKHILLQEGDIIQEGDEYYNYQFNTWVKVAVGIGWKVERSTSPIRRNISQQPEVTLEELMEEYRLAFNGARGHGENPVRDGVEAVCKKLGYTFAPSKEAWEVAYDAWVQLGDNCDEKELAKSVWQACEKHYGVGEK